MIAALLLAAAEPPACSLIWPVAPDEAAARRIAEAVIATRPFQSRQRYILRVTPADDDPGQWVAFETPPPLPPDRHGVVHVQRGGGGLGMRIDRCTGAISRLFYQR
jgi:hypothetical protein